MEYIFATNFKDFDFVLKNDKNPIYRRLGTWVDDIVEGESYEDEMRNSFHLDHMNNEIKLQYKLLLNTLTNLLNEHDERALSIEEGKILYGPWLYHFVSHYFYLFTLLKYINNLNKDVILVCGNDDSKFIFQDTLDHKQKVRHEAYNNRTIKLIANYIGIKVCEYKKNNPPNIKKNFNNQNFAVIFRKIISKFENIFNFRAKVLLKNSYITKNNRLKIFIKSRGIISTITNRPEKLKVINLSANQRSLLEFSLTKDNMNDFENLIFINLISEIPICFIEGFSELKQQVKKKYRNWKPEVVLTGNGWYHDEPFKLWAIQQKRIGVKLVGFQHGGFYFTFKDPFYLNHEIAVTDYYFSWGKSGRNIKSIVPFYMQKKFLNFDSSNKAKINEILLLTNNYSKHDQIFYIFKNPYNHHIKQNSIFLKNLNQSIKVKYRCSFDDYGWGELDYYQKIFPGLKISDRNDDALKEMSGSQLVVFDSIHSTSFLESIVNNIPSIIINSDYQNELHPGAIEIFKKLENSNILFNSGEDCANFVNLNFSNLDEWWFSESTQSVIKEFSQYYARKDINFSKLFIEQISKIRLN